MPLEVKTGTRVSSNLICSMCGLAYSKRNGNFYSSYAALWKGTKHLPVCKTCADELYERYLAECENARAAVRQMCRKFDLPFHENLFESAEVKSTPHTVFQEYMTKINVVAHAGECYDDTLRKDGVLWRFTRVAKGATLRYEETDESRNAGTDIVENGYGEQIPQEVVDFWGGGYTPDMYRELEQRLRFWLSKYPGGADGVDIGQLAILRQICNLELDINRDRAAGRPIDKNVNALNSLLGSANLKPVQKKDDTDANLEQPLGVWLNRYEKKRPLPEVDEDLKDVNKLLKYIIVWVKGHLAKMLGVRNSYSQLYEDEMERLRVEKPEYADEDDDTFLADFLGGSGDEHDEI